MHPPGSRDIRERLTDAALQAYGEHGRAATTRQIADLAGVNEVTLFRHFGSKDALITEALRTCVARARAIALPDRPRDPRREVRRFCLAHLRAMWAVRGVIRQTLSDFEGHPEAVAVSREVTTGMVRELERYLRRLEGAGLIERRAHRRTAVLMLMSALLADAITRDCLPEHYPGSPQRTVDAYATVWLDAIGLVARHGTRHRRSAVRKGVLHS